METQHAEMSKEDLILALERVARERTDFLDEEDLQLARERILVETESYASIASVVEALHHDCIVSAEDTIPEAKNLIDDIDSAGRVTIITFVDGSRLRCEGGDAEVL